MNTLIATSVLLTAASANFYTPLPYHNDYVSSLAHNGFQLHAPDVALVKTRPFAAHADANAHTHGHSIIGPWIHAGLGSMLNYPRPQYAGLQHVPGVEYNGASLGIPEITYAKAAAVHGSVPPITSYGIYDHHYGVGAHGRLLGTQDLAKTAHFDAYAEAVAHNEAFGHHY